MIRGATISEALLATVDRGEGEYVFHLEDGIVRLSCAELAERARLGAKRLLALGVEPGDAVAVLGPNRPEWVVSAFSIWLAGAVLVPVQKRLRVRDPAAFREQLDSLLSVAGCRLALADPTLASLLPDGVGVSWDGAGETSAEEPVAPAPANAAVIQFTSGSTSTPRGALVTHAAAMAQAEILDELIVNGDGYRDSIGWVPFFHDLGLFLNVLPAAVWGLTSHHLPTERFARDPAEWLRLAARTRVAQTITPASGLGNALSALARRSERVDLGALEAVRFAAEGVDPNVLRQLSEAETRLNLRPEALGSSYGMAEVALAVTYSAPGSGLRRERISIDALATDGVAAPAGRGPSRLLVACGAPKMELRIHGPGGEGEGEGDLPERHVGEILLRGPSTMSHYVGPGAPDPFRDGWLRTGDLGYMADGQLYVTGRVKDMVIVMGDNYYPEDFEWAAGRVEGVRPGRCVAFTRPGTDEVVVLVEPVGDGDPGALAISVKNAGADAVGVPPSEVVVLAPGTVDKTTSGKLRRATMRERYLSGTLEAVPA
ncbi:MAG: AMP-binding protein [Solirubrobacterales bacterium]